MCYCVRIAVYVQLFTYSSSNTALSVCVYVYACTQYTQLCHITNYYGFVRRRLNVMYSARESTEINRRSGSMQAVSRPP